MKARSLAPALVLVALLASSCASYTVRRESVERQPEQAAQLSGRVIAVEPATVRFGASRFAIDMRDARITVNGQEIQLDRRYLTKEKDNFLGLVGVLDVNILAKSGMKPERVGLLARDMLVELLSGTRDWKVGFMKGLGESNMGIVSSRPYEQDRSVYPPKGVYLERSGSASLFSGVKSAERGSIPAEADLLLSFDISISSEVIELLEIPQSSLPIDGNRVPQKGDYYLSLLGSYRFNLVDRKTGAVLMNEKTKAEFSSGSLFTRYLYLPVNNGDAGAYAKFFRGVDFEPQVKEVLALVFESIMPQLAPHYVNTYHSEKVEK